MTYRGAPKAVSAAAKAADVVNSVFAFKIILAGRNVCFVSRGWVRGLCLYRL